MSPQVYMYTCISDTWSFCSALTDEDSVSSASASRAQSAHRARSASLGRSRLDPNQPIRMKSARRRTHSSYYDHNTQPALIKSLFQYVPPYLNFVTQDEKSESWRIIFDHGLWGAWYNVLVSYSLLVWLVTHGTACDFVFYAVANFLMNYRKFWTFGR